MSSREILSLHRAMRDDIQDLVTRRPLPGQGLPQIVDAAVGLRRRRDDRRICKGRMLEVLANVFNHQLECLSNPNDLSQKAGLCKKKENAR